MAEPSDQRKYSDWLSGNLVLLATLTLFLLVIMKVARVAHLNVDTAYAILSSTGPINVTLGTLTASLSLLLIVMENVALMIALHTTSKLGRTAAITAVAFLLIISIFVTAWSVTAILVASLIGPLFVVRRFRHPGPVMKRLLERWEPQPGAAVDMKFGVVGKKIGVVNTKLEEVRALRRELYTLAPNTSTAEGGLPIAEKRMETHQQMEDRLADAEQALVDSDQALADAQQALAVSKKETREKEQSLLFLNTVLVVAPLLFLTLTSSTVWLPVEYFTIADGTSIVGYSLRSDADWHAVLVDTPRGVAHLQPRMIMKREICRTGESNSIRPLVDYITGRDATSPYASCDSLKEDGA